MARPRSRGRWLALHGSLCRAVTLPLRGLRPAGASLWRGGEKAGGWICASACPPDGCARSAHRARRGAPSGKPEGGTGGTPARAGRGLPLPRSSNARAACAARRSAPRRSKRSARGAPVAREPQPGLPGAGGPARGPTGAPCRYKGAFWFAFLPGVLLGGIHFSFQACS